MLLEPTRDGDIHAHSAQGRKLDALRSHPEAVYRIRVETVTGRAERPR